MVCEGVVIFCMYVPPSWKEGKYDSCKVKLSCEPALRYGERI